MDDERFQWTETKQKMRLRVANNLVQCGLISIWLELLLLAGGGVASRTGTVSSSASIGAGMGSAVSGSAGGTAAAVIAGILPVLYCLWAEFLQKKASSFVLYSLGHAAGIALVYAVSPWPVSRLISMLLCFLILFLSFYARIHEILLCYPAAGWMAPGVILYFAAAFMGRSDLGTTAMLGEIASAVLFLLCRGQDSLETALGQIPKGGTVPYERIRHAYAGTMGKWLGIGAAAAVLLYLAKFGEQLFDLTRRFCRWLAYWIMTAVLYLMTLFGSGDAGEEQSHSGAALQAMQSGEALPENLERFFDILWKVVMAAAIALVVWLIYRFIRAGLRSLLQDFRGAHMRGTDKVEYYEVKEKAAAEKGPRTDTIRFLDRSPAAGIRRRYVEWVRRGPGAARIRKSETPAELELTAYGAAPQAGGEASETPEKTEPDIHRLYEKARYAPDSCTADDYARMKRAARGYNAAAGK